MSITILLADDDVDDQFFFKEALKSIDPEIQLVIASNGDEALEKLGTFSPEIIFLDINMPFMSGKECLKLIRRDKAFKDIHIVMYTTSAAKKDIEDCFQMGANLFITKPQSQEDNIQTLTSVIALYKDGGLNSSDLPGFVFRQKGAQGGG